MIANLLIAGIGILLAGGILSLKHARALRRTREMRALARRMGWKFQATPSLDVVPDRKRFGLFTVRMHQRIRNHLAGTMGDFQVAVFDLRYSTTGPNAATGSEQTVVHVRSAQLDLPAFSLRPELVFHRAGDRVGGGDIDMGEDPEFSRSYHLLGRDEHAVRDLFDARVREVYNANPGICTDAGGSDLLVWRGAELAAAEDVHALVQTALEVARLHGRAAYQLPGRTHGNHTPHIAARLAARGWGDSYGDLY